jgi:hypothetical protein
MCAALSPTCWSCGPQSSSGASPADDGRLPEFEQAFFRLAPTGILREVVKTRYGFHFVSLNFRIFQCGWRREEIPHVLRTGVGARHPEQPDTVRVFRELQ